MIDRNAQVGWTDAQWNRVRQAIADEWSRARVVGSFLPPSGLLPPSTEVVPSEVITSDGSVDDGATARIVELSSRFTLSAQEVSEEELTDALLSFRRAATALAREEDRLILNGQVPRAELERQGWASPAPASPASQPRFRPIERSGGETLLTPAWIDILEAQVRQPEETRMSPVRTEFYGEFNRLIASVVANGLSPALAREAPPALTLLVNTNPGALGLVLAAGSTVFGSAKDGRDLVRAIIDAISQLDGLGYGPPYACVLGRTPYVTAYEPMRGSLVLPADRIEPLLGRQLIRAPALDEGLRAPEGGRGLVISLAGNSMDLAMAAEATPQFTQIDAQGRYVFRVYERLALRLKDYNAIVRLEFSAAQAPGASRRAGAWPATSDVENERQASNDVEVRPQTLSDTTSPLSRFFRRFFRAARGIGSARVPS